MKVDVEIPLLHIGVNRRRTIRRGDLALTLSLSSGIVPSFRWKPVHRSRIGQRLRSGEIVMRSALRPVHGRLCREIARTSPYAAILGGGKFPRHTV